MYLMWRYMYSVYISLWEQGGIFIVPHLPWHAPSVLLRQAAGSASSEWAMVRSPLIYLSPLDGRESCILTVVCVDVNTWLSWVLRRIGNTEEVLKWCIILKLQNNAAWGSRPDNLLNTYYDSKLDENFLSDSFNQTFHSLVYIIRKGYCATYQYKDEHLRNKYNGGTHKNEYVM